MKVCLRYLPVVLLVFSILSLNGCIWIEEDVKCIAGVSVDELKAKRKDAVRKTFSCDYYTVFNKAEAVLKDIGCYIYSKNKKKQYIAVYVSSEDTTAVGIFFSSIDANNTQLEVISPSIYAKELIAVKLFSGIDESLISDQGKGKTNVQK